MRCHTSTTNRHVLHARSTPGVSLPLSLLALTILAGPACRTSPPRSTPSGEGELTASPCLSPTLDRRVELATLRDGAPVSVGRKPFTVELQGAPFTVCVPTAAAGADRSGQRRVIGIGRGLAVRVHAAAAALAPAPVTEAGWASLRRRVAEDGQQVGCLKRLPRGTQLFDRPDGEVVGVVVDSSVPYGKWDSTQTASAVWSLLRVNLGFGPFQVWIKDSPADWCPP